MNCSNCNNQDTIDINGKWFCMNCIPAIVYELVAAKCIEHGNCFGTIYRSCIKQIPNKNSLFIVMDYLGYRPHNE